MRNKSYRTRSAGIEPGVFVHVVSKGVGGALLLLAPLMVLAMTVTVTQELVFGAVVAGSTGGTVTVSSSGSRSCTAGLTCVPQSSWHPARFDIAGDPLMSFSISLPTSATLSDGTGSSMTIDGFEDSLGGSGTLDLAGQASFYVGADLHVGAGQAASSYSGSFTVTVAYQ